MLSPKNPFELELHSEQFTSLVQGETLATLGTGLDEMMRHVHSLRQPVVSMLLQVVNNLITRGSGQAGVKALPGNNAEAVQPMDTDDNQTMSNPASSPAGPLTPGE